MAALADMTPDQRGAIFKLARVIGMDRESLHDMVAALTKRQSIAALKKHEATVVIKTLLKHANPKALNREKGNVIYLVAPGQLEHIRTLAEKMLWNDEQIDKLSRRMYKKPFRLLLVIQAQGLIEGMKSILERKGTVAS